MTISPHERGERLQIVPTCRSCLEGLAQTAVGLAWAGDPVLAKRAGLASQEALEQGLLTNLASAQVANRVFWAVTRATGNKDPYAAFKAEEIATARRTFEAARHLTGHDLRSLVSLAAMGNSLDFFKAPAEAMAEVEAHAVAGLGFERDDIARLEEALAKRLGLVLYLADNTGEVFFDRPLYEYVRERSRRAVLVVKGGPALNDLTRESLAASGLAGRFDEVADTGVAGVGVEWQEATPEFLELVESADLVISKGMANLETIYNHPLNAPVFFLFRVKCQPIQDFLGARSGGFWAMWREAAKDTETMIQSTYPR
jgi:uncharacterized protein with ATP-grasp and redox domains